MCEFHELYVCEQGYVVRCKECSYYQLCYGSTVLTLNDPDFKIFYQLSGKMLEEKNDYPDEELKQIIIPTPYAGVNMLLSMKDIRNLFDMMEKGVI
jgi:hypothetical protein